MMNIVYLFMEGDYNNVTKAFAKILTGSSEVPKLGTRHNEDTYAFCGVPF